MTTLKEHQAAMVNLLASGSGIPASASRLAHALHDVLALITTQPVAATAHTERRSDATTPGLNDKLLALDVEAVRPSTSIATPRIKQLENTCSQLRENLRTERLRVAELVAVVGALQEEILDLRGLGDD